MAAGASHRHVDADGVSLFVRRHGAGWRAVVFWHGLGALATGDAVQAAAPLLCERLDASVYALDAPGFGRSQPPLPPERPGGRRCSPRQPGGVASEPPRLVWADIDRAGVPVLLLSAGEPRGDAERIRQVAAFRTALPHAAVREVARAGHDVLADGGTQLVATIADWVLATPRAPTA